MVNRQHSIGKEQAIKLYDSNWWKNKPAKDIVQFQLFTAELSMDFGDFQKALEECLGRPVFTHELGLSYDRICDEFLGKKEAPSFEEIINLIPKDKRICVIAQT